MRGCIGLTGIAPVLRDPIEGWLACLVGWSPPYAGFGDRMQAGLAAGAGGGLVLDWEG